MGAITETGLHSAVNGGEKPVKIWHHAPVVRWLRKQEMRHPRGALVYGRIRFEMDSAWKRSNLRIVAFVQEKRPRHILGAAATRLEP